MARKIIRAADRDKAREESKKAAEAVPVKPVEAVKPAQKTKPGKIQSINDFDELSFSTLNSSISTSLYPKWELANVSKPQPSDFTLDDMLKFVGAPSPGEEIKYRTDGVIVGNGFIYATDLKCSLRVNDACMVDFDLYSHVNGDVKRGYADSAPVVGYTYGKAGCNGTDLETPPMHKMPWSALSGNSAPLSWYNVEPVVETIKCPSATCDNGFHKKCPSCSGLGCKSCANKGGTPCYVCMGCRHITRISGYRFIPKQSAGEFILAPDLYNKIVGLPDLGIYPPKLKGVIGFDFRVNKNHRGQGLCITMDEPKVTGEFTVPKKTQSKADVAKEFGVDPSKTMLSGSGGSVGKTNTNAVDFAKMVKMFPATHDGFSGPSTIMGMGGSAKNP